MRTQIAQELENEIEIFNSHLISSEKKIYGDIYGDISLRNELEKYVKDISSKNQTVMLVLDWLSNDVIREYKQALGETNSQFTQLISYQPEDFIKNRSGHLGNIISFHERISRLWGIIYAFYMQYYPNEISDLVDKLKDKLSTANDSVIKANSAAQASITTVQGLSFVSVQEIWRKSKNGMAFKMLINAILLCIAIYVFFNYAMFFLDEVNTFEDSWTWKIAYLASIRFVILGFLIAIVHFLINTLRSYLHLYESSLHKLNITNAIPVFHESVADVEKDKVFFRLLDGLMSFGETGFLKSDFKDPTSNFPSINLNDKKSD